jgi:endonuclease IV
MIFGAHTIDAGGIHMAARRAARGGMRALQVFTAKPQFYNEKISVRPERVERFRAALADSDIRPEHIVAHAAYVLSVATPDDAKYARASAGLAKEVERAAALGIGAVCFHPGSAQDGERSASGEAHRQGHRERAREDAGYDASAGGEHGRCRAHDGTDGRRGRRDSFARAGVAARSHRVRARHVSSICERS